VLIAGKGHETYQEVNGLRTDFDDRQWSRLALLLKDGLELQSDSRKIGPAAVFIALKGETFDGHDYLEQVRASGALAAIVNRIDPAVCLSQIAVGDTRQGLLQIGKAWREQFDIPVIAVTGSNGKTTTKEMIASILAAWLGESQRLATAGNLNNELGVPFTLLRLGTQHRAAVIELGMNHPGEIAVLANTTAPTVALVNNAQREHQEFMVSVEAVAKENGQVLLSLPAGGVAVYPANDTYTLLWDEMSGEHKRLHFGLTQQAQIWPSNIQSDALGTSFLMHTPVGEHQVELSVPGAHNLSNALAAAACGLAAGAPLKSVAQGLSDFHAVSGRMQPHRLAAGIVMIDDTYNANPDSVRAAIDVLASMSGPRVLVLGDMGEVGDNGPAMHYEVGEYARQKGIENLLTLGQATQESARAFGAGAVVCASTERACDALANIPAKSVLVKGSRFMRMERIVREYLERFSEVPGDLVNHAV
jgi:murE/murF fusion protein